MAIEPTPQKSKAWRPAVPSEAAPAVAWYLVVVFLSLPVLAVVLWRLFG